MNIRNILLACSIASLLTLSCKKDNKEVLIPYNHDILFEEFELSRFSFQIKQQPFVAGDDLTGRITLNAKSTGGSSFQGFAISNKNWRSYPWNLSPTFHPGTLTATERQSSIDSTIFSVFTSRPNHTLNYLVVNTEDGQAFFTLDKPRVVEHVLVANTTYNYLLETYGSNYSGTLDATTQSYSMTGNPVANPMIPNTSTTLYGRFYLPGYNGQDVVRLAGAEILEKQKAGKAAADLARSQSKPVDQVTADSVAAATALASGYVKLTATGFKGGNATPNKVDYYLAIRPNVSPDQPTLAYIANDWFKVDLSSLGEVDKVLFELSSSYVDTNGKMLYPPFFCMDGVRLRK